MYLQVRAGRRLGTGQTLILNKLTDALHCTGDNQDSLAPCLVYMRTKVRSVMCPQLCLSVSKPFLM